MLTLIMELSIEQSSNYLMMNFLKILLIEDNPADVLLLKKKLAQYRNNCFEIKESERLFDALNLLKQENFDAVLLDLGLPDSQGLESVRQVSATASTIPVIVMTAIDNQETASAAIHEGAQDYIIKDEIHPNLLPRAIHHAIERKQVIETLRQNEIRYRGVIASLFESEERFRLMVNSTSVLIWMSDRDGRSIFFNQSWLDFTGHSLEQELLHDWSKNIHPEDRAKSLMAYQTAFKNRDRLEIEYRLLRQDGEYRWILNTGVPRFVECHEFTGYISSCVDISEHKQAKEILAQQLHKERLIAEVVQNIHSSLDLEIVIETVVEDIQSFLAVENLTIFQLNREASLKENCNRQWHLLFEYVAPKFACGCQVKDFAREELLKIAQQNFDRLTAGKMIVISNLNRQTENIDIVINLSHRSASMTVPIVFEEKLWGFLCARQSESRHWQSLEIDLVQQIVMQLAIAIHQCELYNQLEKTKKELESLAIVDSLTQVYNRRKFDEYLETEWRRLAREKSPLSLILCDIDYFKLYNDTYGHQAGDRCLRQVARAIALAVKRSADLVARYGGEEFAVILPNTDPAGAAIVAEEIRTSVKALNLTHVNSLVDNCVTISLGVAGSIPTHNLSSENLITAADRALYKSKTLGRDRFSLASF